MFICLFLIIQLDEGECFGKMVIDMGEKAAEFRAKGYLAIGLVYSLKATDGKSGQQKRVLSKSSVQIEGNPGHHNYNVQDALKGIVDKTKLQTFL